MNKRSYKMLNICTNEKICKVLVNALISFGVIQIVTKSQNFRSRKAIVLVQLKIRLIIWN